MFQNQFFQDPRYRRNRIMMVIMIPLAVVVLAGIGVLLGSSGKLMGKRTGKELVFG